MAKISQNTRNHAKTFQLKTNPRTPQTNFKARPAIPRKTHTAVITKQISAKITRKVIIFYTPPLFKVFLSSIIFFLPRNKFRIRKCLNPLTEVTPFIELVIFSHRINVCKNFVVQHDRTFLIVRARKKLDHLPPVFLVMSFQI